MIFITPYVIKDEDEAYAITKTKSEGLEEFRKEYHIEKKSSQPTMLAPVESRTPGKGGLQEKEEQPMLQSAPTATPVLRSAPSGTSPLALPVPGGVQSAPSGTSPLALPVPGGVQSAPSGTSPLAPPVPGRVQSAPSGTSPLAPPVPGRVQSAPSSTAPAPGEMPLETGLTGTPPEGAR